MRVIDLSTLSLVGGSGIAEAKIPLWFSDGTSFATASNINSAGANFIQDGTTSPATNNTASASHLFTLSSNWSASTKLAFESAFWSGNSSYTAYVSLWDMTPNTQVTASQMSTTNNSATLMRSTQFTLTPGHSYGVTIWISATVGAAISDASLIIFP